MGDHLLNTLQELRREGDTELLGGLAESMRRWTHSWTEGYDDAPLRSVLREHQQWPSHNADLSALARVAAVLLLCGEALR